MKNRKKALFSKKKFVNSTLLLISFLLMTCAAWVSGDSFFTSSIHITTETPKLLSNQTGDDLTACHVNAIHNAKKSVLFMIFALTNDHVIKSLRQKSEEGIPVKVICDAKASPHIIQKLGPQVEVIRRFSKGHMHLKILVIDQEDCWIGSANMTGESLNMHGNLVIAIKSPPIAAMIQEKAMTLQEYDRKGEVNHCVFNIGEQKIELSFLPDDRKGCQRIKDLINSAQKTVRVAMFTWTRFDFVQTLIQAKKRGVEVEVVLDNSSAKGASAKIAELLKKEKIAISYSRGGSSLLHHKFVWIDGKTLEMGSANWTKAAFNQNDDCFLIIHALTQDQQKHMEALWRAIKADSCQKL